ncbi:MAG: adenylosuccinate lyase family protein [Saprospiraceae bacterium]|nr:adenylosuccinate lyase family protein [Lewinella sp.]
MPEIYSKYLSDPEIAACCSDEQFIRHMLNAEIALAEAQAQLGVIPKKAAREIAQVLEGGQPDSTQLADGTLANGIPIIPLLAIVKQKLSAETQDYLHWGATSQDIVDTANVMIIRDVLKIIKIRLEEIIKHLKTLSNKHQQTLTVARTRTQQAVPITYAQKIDNWRIPLERHLKRLDQLRPRLLVVQLGGAGGNLSVLGELGADTARLMAERLNLGYIGVWHNQRDNLVEFSNWLALLTGSLGKMAQDILLLAQTEVGEIVENAEGGGGSSTMPHKNNPVLSEATVALSRYVGQLAGANFQTILHQHERDGASWALEWLTYPQMMMATGSALNHALTISKNMQINKAAVRANLEKLNGLVFSERASFILAEYRSRKEAKKIVSEACELALAENIHLAEALIKLVPELDIDWKEQLASNQ